MRFLIVATVLLLNNTIFGQSKIELLQKSGFGILPAGNTITMPDGTYGYTNQIPMIIKFTSMKNQKGRIRIFPFYFSGENQEMKTYSIEKKESEIIKPSQFRAIKSVKFHNLVSPIITDEENRGVLLKCTFNKSQSNCYQHGRNQIFGQGKVYKYKHLFWIKFSESSSENGLIFQIDSDKLNANVRCKTTVLYWEGEECWQLK